MKRWPFAVVLFLLLVTPVLAIGPSSSQVTTTPLWVRYIPFPAYKEAVVEQNVDPHTRIRLTVTGEDWSLSLVRRRWGWEMETLYAERVPVRALAYASLDYLWGNPEALGIFVDLPLEYVQLLASIAS